MGHHLPQDVFIDLKEAKRLYDIAGVEMESERVFFKPGVDSPMDVAARAYEAQVNAEIRHMERHHGL